MPAPPALSDPGVSEGAREDSLTSSEDKGVAASDPTSVGEEAAPMDDRPVDDRSIGEGKTPKAPPPKGGARYTPSTKGNKAGLSGSPRVQRVTASQNN